MVQPAGTLRCEGDGGILPRRVRLGRGRPRGGRGRQPRRRRVRAPARLDRRGVPARRGRHAELAHAESRERRERVGYDPGRRRDPSGRGAARALSTVARPLRGLCQRSACDRPRARDLPAVPRAEPRAVFAGRLRDIVELAQARGKIPALTETGVEAVPDSLWWTGTLLAGIKSDSVARRIAWVLVWRNATFEREHRYHFFAPFPGQA